MNQIVPQPTPAACGFTQLLSSTRRGARLARLLAVSSLHSWGAPQELTERAELIVAELAANAVVHGHVPGRDFRLALHFDPATGLLRVEITDARGERLPRPSHEHRPLSTGGYGLTLVTALADHWETVPHQDRPGRPDRADADSGAGLSGRPSWLRRTQKTRSGQGRPPRRKRVDTANTPPYGGS
ncbi:ATP-binding protein [Streptomyces sp. NPDC059949]|uniref:ATP-binding protein n=1 Tax=Streptomyces sp. NPDC059949 TaxID=3347013 RepID=UPI00365BA216